MKRTAILVSVAVAISTVPIQAEMIQPVKAAVFRSTGTMFLGQTIWGELNSNWSAYGDVPVQVDYTSLAGNNITASQLEASGADVVILSAPGYLTYKLTEVTALKQYVEAGHGLVITYGTFWSQDLWLAPLVGLTTTNAYHTVTLNDPILVDLLAPAHFLFAGIETPYISGTSVRVRPPLYEDWHLGDGNVVANVRTTIAHATPGIITHETPDYRGVYFSYYIEDGSGGSNTQDKQVFYNSLLWVKGLPEPASGLMFFTALMAMLLRRSR